LPLWEKIADNQEGFLSQTSEAVDLDLLFKDYEATVDWPACNIYKALMKKYPSAKVL
jgi:hypothetical protein